MKNSVDYELRFSVLPQHMGLASAPANWRVYLKSGAELRGDDERVQSLNYSERDRRGHLRMVLRLPGGETPWMLTLDHVPVSFHLEHLTGPYSRKGK